MNEDFEQKVKIFLKKKVSIAWRVDVQLIPFTEFKSKTRFDACSLGKTF